MATKNNMARSETAKSEALAEADRHLEAERQARERLTTIEEKIAPAEAALASAQAAHDELLFMVEVGEGDEADARATRAALHAAQSKVDNLRRIKATAEDKLRQAQAAQRVFAKADLRRPASAKPISRWPWPATSPRAFPSFTGPPTDPRESCLWMARCPAGC